MPKAVERASTRIATLRQEFPPLARLAWPLVVANLGWMTMGTVDTMMVGRLSPEAIGAVSLGSILFMTVGLLGGGIMLGLDALIPQAFGAGRIEDCHRSLVSSLYLSLAAAVVLAMVVWLGVPLLGRASINPGVLRLTIPYIRALDWGMLPLMFYMAARSYLQALDQVRPIMFALISANVINALGDWALIYGHLGAPAMGAIGSGWSTSFSRLYLAVALMAAIVLHDRRQKPGLFDTPLAVDFRRIGRILKLGLPAALQITVEVAVFALATALIARLSAVSLAAHQIALNVVSVTYMVPLAVGSAAAVRVGQALGRGDVHHAEHAGWAALGLGVGFMFLSALTLWLVPRWIARAFTPDLAVVNAGATLLGVAALFQIFDGLQVVATGALRGAGDTTTPMVCHLVAYWAIGLPLGYMLCFRVGWGALGLWAGFCLALILLGCVLLLAWRGKVGRLISVARSEGVATAIEEAR